jgi:hypothetical protein
MRQMDYDAAEQSLIRAVELDPLHNVVVRRQWGRLGLARAPFADVVTQLKSVSDDPEATATDHAYLGWACLSQNQLSEAEAAFNAALAMDAEHAFAVEGRCWLALLRGTVPTVDWDDLKSRSASPIRIATAHYWANQIENPSSGTIRAGPFTALGVAGFWSEGLHILVVLESSPAHALGIRPGDRIIEIDGVPLDGERDWDAALSPSSRTGVAIVSWVSSGETLTRVASFADAAGPSDGIDS